MNIPFLGWHLRLSGHVPVDRRQGRRAAVEVIRRFQDVLEEEKKLLIFPEGTRSEDGNVQEFKNGGFYAAVRANRPVVPVAISGTHGLLSKGEPYVRAGRHVYVRMGDPIYPDSEGKEGVRVAKLRDEARAAVTALHNQIKHLPVL